MSWRSKIYFIVNQSGKQSQVIHRTDWYFDGFHFQRLHTAVCSSPSQLTLTLPLCYRAQNTRQCLNHHDSFSPIIHFRLKRDWYKSTSTQLMKFHNSVNLELGRTGPQVASMVWAVTGSSFGLTCSCKASLEGLCYSIFYLEVFVTVYTIKI